MLIDLLAQLGQHPSGSVSQLIHGDLSGNVLFAPGLPPAIIDFSPYWRPPGFAYAIAAVDGVLWHGEGKALLRRAADEEGGVDVVVRALLFRLIALNERSRFDPRALDELPQVRAAAAMVEDLRSA